ncbi:alkyldihydroxyacetonephosphate synthase, putative [gamma proteobacterium HTCC5015]|nr:alkyldihydroxyacetonephosphate synthase, putative [gamma proteobacterium HTCC5015]
MRRWNGWGEEKNDMALPRGARQILEGFLGAARPLPDASLEQVLKSVPASRISDGLHPLLKTDADTRLRHARGQSLPDWLAMRSGEFGVFPDAVAFPESGEQIQALLQLAERENLELIPYGGGTSVAGHITPQASDRPIVTVALTRMNRLLDLDTESQVATFGAGANGPQVEAQLRAQGYMLGHFPQSWELSTLGGWVASRSSGQQSLRYGRIEQLFAGGRMETLRGTLDIPTIPASSAGPDLREWVLGSEGRMGILSDVKVRVSPLPEKEQFYTVFMPNWHQAMRAAQRIAQQRVPLSMMRASNAKETYTGVRLAVEESKVQWLDRYLRLRGLDEHACMVTFGVTGSSAQVQSAYRQAMRVFRELGAVSVLSSKLGNKWEHGRFRFPYLRHALWKLGYAVDTFETAVDWSQLGPYVEAAEQRVSQALADEGEPVHVFTHLSHLYPQGSSAYTTYIYRCADSYAGTLQRWKKLKKAASETVVEHGGTISHQHGVGRDHAPWLAAEKTQLGLETLKTVFDYYDPEGRLNPGVLLVDGEVLG